MSLYLKSKLLGENNNTLPLTQKMDVLLHASNEVYEK
jgi:hypothetical protein